MSFSDIEKIPVTNFNDIFLLIQNGVIGWGSTSQTAYQTYAASHNLQQTLVMVNSGKKHKYQKPDGYDKLYPAHYKLMTMGHEPPSRTFTRDTISILAGHNMPSHIKQRLGVK